jgi:succinate dehydrogenase/fumarate reductase flavoprotein subunit
MAVGNRLLESLDGGANAGTSAAEHAADSQFSDSDAIDSALTVAADRFGKLLAATDSGMTRGQVSTQLNSIMSDSMGVSREGASLTGAAERLSQLAETQITLSDESPVMNTELVEVFRLEGMVRVSQNAVESAMGRVESCGSHQRSDE